MPQEPDPYLIDEDNPEWTEEMFANAKPAREVMPPEFFEAMKSLKEKRGPGRPPLANPKQHIGMRLDADIVEWLREQKGYNGIVNNALRDIMEKTSS